MNSGEHHKFAVIILAAGSSSRFGSNKLLMNLKNQSVLMRALQPFISLQEKCDPILIITGAFHEEIEDHLQNLNVVLQYNDEYMNGNMSTSIRKAISYLWQNNFTGDGIIIHLGDIPYIQTQDIELLISAFSSRKRQILIPCIDSKKGHPILFDTSYMDALSNLESKEQGMKSLINECETDVILIQTKNKGILFDIDFPQDLETESY